MNYWFPINQNTSFSFISMGERLLIFWSQYIEGIWNENFFLLFPFSLNSRLRVYHTQCYNYNKFWHLQLFVKLAMCYNYNLSCPNIQKFGIHLSFIICPHRVCKFYGKDKKEDKGGGGGKPYLCVSKVLPTATQIMSLKLMRGKMQLLFFFPKVCTWCDHRNTIHVYKSGRAVYVSTAQAPLRLTLIHGKLCAHRCQGKQ